MLHLCKSASMHKEEATKKKFTMTSFLTTGRADGLYNDDVLTITFAFRAQFKPIIYKTCLKGKVLDGFREF